MKHILILLIISTGVLIGCGDDKDPDPIDPQIAILGKWEVIETGNWPDMHEVNYHDIGYTEYLEDSIVRSFDYKKMQFNAPSKYWIIDSILYEGVYRSDGQSIIFKQQIQFFENKLRLDLLEVYPIFSTTILKKI